MSDVIIRASSIGFPCERSIWHGARGDVAVVPPSTERIFDMGRLLEPIALEWARRDGWNMTANPGGPTASLTLSIPITGGRIEGHPDAKGNLPGVHDEDMIVDVKSMNSGHYSHWRRDGTEKSYPQYVDQVTVYTEGHRLMQGSARPFEKMAILGANKNDSRYYVDVMRYDPDRLLRIIEKAERIVKCVIDDVAPEIDTTIPSWCCSRCFYKDICPGMPTDQVSDITDNTIVEVNDEDLLMAALNLDQARALRKMAQRMEEESKLTIADAMTEHETTALKTGEYVLTVNTSTERRFSPALLKKANPELYEAMREEKSKTRYDVRKVGDTGDEDDR